ncbi:MAG: hypothetical protein ABI702_11200 [Burkholderiales bacterium]
MDIGRPGWSETWRVLAYTLAIALGFIALGRLQIAVVGGIVSHELLGRAGLVESVEDSAALQRQAAQIAASARVVSQRLPAGHRLAAFRIGYELGYVSELTGSVSRSNAELRAKVQALADAHIETSHTMAKALGVPEEAALPVRTLQEFGDLAQRIDDDENGAAARIERQLSALHRHLYLLGVQLGVETARVETTGGQMSLPPAKSIMRHATLAGIDAALWQPLARMPRDETPAQVLARYRNALNALGAALAQPG